MWTWKDVSNLRVFKTLRMKVGAIMRLENADHTTADVTVPQLSTLVPGQRLVNTTATALALAVALHEGKTVKVSSTAPIAVTLPAATGSGAKFALVVAVAATATPHTISAAGTDKFVGVSLIQNTTTTQVAGFATTSTSNTISLNGTTKGGYVGDRVELEDIATGKFAVRITGKATGVVVTPFSNV